MKDLMAAIAPLVADDRTIIAVVAGLLIWAVVSGAQLWRGTAILKAALNRATRRIAEAPDARGFVSQYEAISADLAADPILGARWREVDDSLVIPRAGSRVIQSTSRLDAWFNLSLLRIPVLRVDARYHAALPNLLVGAGLLFTFLGLAAALTSAGGVMAGGAQDRNDALRTLLDQASAKFITSLVGLGLSIGYALFRKWRLKGVERALDHFLAAFEERAPLLTPASLQQEANALLERQHETLESFSTTLAINIGQAFDRAFDHRLGEHIAPLTAAMERLAARESADIGTAIDRMLGEFLKGLQGGAGDTMTNAAASLARVGEQLEGLQAGLGEAAGRMTGAADAMAARMGEGAKDALAGMTDEIGRLTGALRGMADQTRDAGASAGRELAERMEAAAGGFEGAARNVAAALTGAASGLEGRMGEQAEASAARMSAQVEALVGQLSGLAESSRSAGAEAFAALADRVGAAASGFEATAAKVSEALERAATDTGGALGRGAEEAVRRIADATEGMRNEMAALIGEFRGAAASAGETLREGGAAGAQALRTTLDGAGGAVSAALSEAAGRLATAGDQAGAALQRGGEAAGVRLDEAGAGFGGRADGLARQVAALAAASDGVAVRLRELDGATRSAASPLIATAADLKAAGEAARAGVEPLVAAAGAVGRALDGVAAASGRLEAAAGTATRLGDSMTNAANRFAGVDRELAGTLNALQQGLRSFTSEVAKSVTDTDRNLAGAANTLGQIVKALQDTLEDLELTRGAPNGGPTRPGLAPPRVR